MPQASNIGNQPFLWLEQRQTSTPHAVSMGYSSIQKNFTKKQFEVKPAVKPETASWENFISLLEKYFFSVEKLFFSNWALSEALFDAFLLVFDLIWLLSVNTKKFYVFIFASTNIKIHILWAMSFEIRQKNIRVKRTFFRGHPSYLRHPRAIVRPFKSKYANRLYFSK